MAATVSKKNQKNTLGARKKNRFKNVLCAPHKDIIPRLDTGVETALLERLTRTIRGHFDSKNISSLKKELKLGANETIRALERDIVSLVIVDKSIHFLTKHLLQLAGARQCPIIVAQHSLQKMSSHFPQLTRLSCVGFLKSCTGPMNEFVDYAASVAPSVELPWLDFEQAIHEQFVEGEETEDNIEEGLNDGAAVQKRNDVMGDNGNSAGDNGNVTEAVAKNADFQHNDYSHLYVKKKPSKEVSKEEVIPSPTKKEQGSFGGAFIAFGSDSDSDDMEEFISRSGRIKYLPKHEPEKTRKAEFMAYNKKHVLGLEDGSRFKRKKTQPVERFYEPGTKAIRRSPAYITMDVGKVQGNPHRKQGKTKKNK